MSLTRYLCDGLKPKNKSFKKFDGEGLYLEVTPKGKKHWRLKYRFSGKEKRLSFGSYPLITLKEAREKRREAKILLNQGIDPAEAKKQKKQYIKLSQQNTFKAIAEEWYKMKEMNWSKSYSDIVKNRLEKDVYPFIGKSPINKLAPPDLLFVLRNIENRGAYYQIKRTRQICSQIFRFGIQTGICNENPCVHLVGATPSIKVQHFSALESKDLPEFLENLMRNDARLYARTRRAIWFSLLTFQRPGEIRQSRWEDLDLEEGIWLIPSIFMKMRKDHYVPLSKQVIAILRRQHEEIGHLDTPWVFPSQIRSKQPMSDGTVNVAIKRMGYKGRMTAHGFRALARTTIREKLKYYPDIIEAQLAHKPSGPLGSAYDRAQFLDDRKILMQDWADYIFELIEHNNLFPLKIHKS